MKPTKITAYTSARPLLLAETGRSGSGLLDLAEVDALELLLELAEQQDVGVDQRVDGLCVIYILLSFVYSSSKLVVSISLLTLGMNSGVY